MSNRVHWADTAKALGIFLVFLGHFIEKNAYGGNNFLLLIYRYIYAFHMPFFFLLAGFFFRKKDISYGLLFIDKLKTRLVPVAFFVAIALPLWMHPNWWGMTDIVPEQELQKVWLLLQGLPVANWPCWFLVCLFSVELIASELVPLLNTRTKLLVVIPAVYGLARLSTDNLQQVASLFGVTENWWFLQESMMALFFYLCGVALARHGSQLLPTTHNIFTVAKLSVFTMVLIVAQIYLFPDDRSSVNMSAAAHGSRFWFPIAALAGSMALIQFSSFIPQHRFIVFIGQNTLPLIGLCGLFLIFFNYYLWLPLGSIDNSGLLLVCSLLMSALSIVLCAPVVVFFNRFTPYLIGRWK